MEGIFKNSAHLKRSSELKWILRIILFQSFIYLILLNWNQTFVCLFLEY